MGTELTIVDNGKPADEEAVEQTQPPENIDPEVDIENFKMPEINLPGVLHLRDEFMDFRSVPERAIMILALRAMGFSITRVATLCGITRATVQYHCDKYDPKGICQISERDRRIISSEMLQSTALAALSHITDEKLKELPADKLATTASKCINSAERIRALEHLKRDGDEAPKLSSMMDYLDQADHSEEGEEE